jgi:hypothetical protein
VFSFPLMLVVKDIIAIVDFLVYHGFATDNQSLDVIRLVGRDERPRNS